MHSKIALVAALMAATPLPCFAQSAVDAVALTQWGATTSSRYYRLLKRSPTSIEFQSLGSSPTDLKVDETGPCKFSISYNEPKYASGYRGTLDYTAARWTSVLTTRMKMVDGSQGFPIVHVPGARYCHVSGFSSADYQITPGACRDFAASNLVDTTANGISMLKRFCPGRRP